MDNTTKSGIQSPAADYNGAKPKNIEAPVKVYEGSKNIGKGASKDGGMIEGPCKDKY